MFLTLNFTPVAYIVSEAAAAASMHIVKAITYGRFNLMSWSIFLNGLFIGCAMMVGNFIALLLSAMPTRNAINVLSLAS